MTSPFDVLRLADTYADRVYDFRRRPTYETQHDMLLFREALYNELHKLCNQQESNNETIALRHTPQP